MGIRSIKPILFNTEMVRAILDGRKSVTRRVVKFLNNRNLQWSGYVADGSVLYGSNNIPAAKAPYRPGDILWVRETWSRISFGRCTQIYVYRASEEPPFPTIGCHLTDHFKWRPSIHMPKEAARIWLRVTDVRVERVQEITDREAEKEGVGNLFYEEIGFGNKDYGWAANPWVWVVVFERCEKPKDAGERRRP